MAAITERLAAIPVEEIGEEAADVRVGVALATVFAAIFIAVGWVAGRAIYGCAFAVKSVRYGYRQGARIRRVPQEPQRAGHGGRPGPGGTYIES